MRLHASELRVRIAVSGCRGKLGLPMAGGVPETVAWFFHPLSGFFHRDARFAPRCGCTGYRCTGYRYTDIRDTDIRDIRDTDIRDTAFCLLYKALHFYGGGSFLTLPLALYRVNPLLGRQT